MSADLLSSLFQKFDRNVASVLGEREYITPSVFARDIGVTRARVYAMLKKGQVPGAQRIENGGTGLWFIPKDHRYKKGVRGRLPDPLTREVFQEYLNSKGTPLTRIRKVQTEKYGSWMRRVEPERFEKRFQNWKGRKERWRDYVKKRYKKRGEV